MPDALPDATLTIYPDMGPVQGVQVLAPILWLGWLKSQLNSTNSNIPLSLLMGKDYISYYLSHYVFLLYSII